MELRFVHFPALRATFSTLRCLAEHDDVIASAREVMFSPVCWLVGLFTQKILDEFQQSLADTVNFGSAPDKGTDPRFFFVMLVNIVWWGMSTFLFISRRI